MANPVVDTSEPDPVVVVVEEDGNVNVTVSGEGPQGPSGPGASDHLTWNQNVASALWVIPHGLGKFPSVTVFDSANTQVEGDVQHISNNELTITFGAAFSGTAYLN